MAALVRLYSLALNWGNVHSGYGKPFFRARVSRLLRESLQGDAAQFARDVSLRRLGRALQEDDGVIGASLLARQLEMELERLESGKGNIDHARSLYEKALAMDPQAGWALPFCQKLDAMAT